MYDRADFKIFSAERHLIRLKELEEKYGTLVHTDIHIIAEIELDEFFYQIISAKKTLIQEINSKLNIGIDIRDVSLSEVNKKLKNHPRQISWQN